MRTINYIACMCEIIKYFDVQESKGLTSAVAPERPDSALTPVYKTHWGTHFNVVFPEIRRIAVRHGLNATTEATWYQKDGRWTRLMPFPGVVKKDTYVFVELRLV